MMIKRTKQSFKSGTWRFDPDEETILSVHALFSYFHDKNTNTKKHSFFVLNLLKVVIAAGRDKMFILHERRQTRNIYKSKMIQWLTPLSTIAHSTFNQTRYSVISTVLIITMISFIANFTRRMTELKHFCFFFIRTMCVNQNAKSMISPVDALLWVCVV